MKMKDCNKKYKNMFPEFKDVIATLREDNPHFAKMFENHEELDKQIISLEQNPVNQINDNIEVLKRKKLKIKDEMYKILKASQNQ
ncbi:YdcH family protein [Acinetobacter equi]|uniref:DUF465 domain-containing protein n=1 Tax=Acinetobacter equi TaxID=1324350 RepID=A0A0N9VNX2_9GAMM|nr:YdcH family protein [Acinetobacter equi]ALH95070.1 hypothetical protein AOY20_05690 [Acinetobacter equi]